MLSIMTQELSCYGKNKLVYEKLKKPGKSWFFYVKQNVTFVYNTYKFKLNKNHESYH